jgi:hypothetical protein
VKGFALMIQGTVENNYWFELAGLLLLAVAILKKGCCGSSACATNKNELSTIVKEIEHERTYTTE